MTTEKSVSQILFDAVNALRRFGHIKWVRHGISGRMCALGAIEYALGPGNQYRANDKTSAVQALGHHVPPVKVGEDYDNPICAVIAAWNNAPHRTADEVIAVFEAAAHCEAGKETADVAP